MLSLGKMDHGQERYYTEAVAAGREDYYLGKGEAPGRWVGRGLDDLALSGQVDAETLGALLRGVDPATGAQLGQHREGGRVAGWDATFSAPKSVSLLWMLGDPGVSEQVRQAHDAAVDQALRYLEDQAAFGRRGHDGLDQVATRGFIGAAFRHRTSRELDPQLHTHVLVANVARGTDGKWGALDGRLMYAHSKTAGYLYEANLRHELTARLGLEFQPARNGIGDLRGFSPGVLRAFSRRREQIEARMAERGESSPRAAQMAALDTRKRKPEEMDYPAVSAEWRSRADSLGMTAERMAGLTGRVQVEPVRRGEVERLYDELGSPHGLTRQASAFSRRDVVMAIAERMPQGATVEMVEVLADGFLGSDRAVSLGEVGQDGRTVHRSGDVISVAGPGGVTVPNAAPTDRERFSTPELLATEASLVLLAQGRATSGAGLVEPEKVRAVLAARPVLSDEQRAMIVRLTRSGAGVDVVQGAGGAGKTYALDACRQAWQEAGHPVAGYTVAAAAARRLQAGSGIHSDTLASLRTKLGMGDTLPARAVVVVDEAGMVGTRDMAWLAQEVAGVDGKLVLVGDSKQLAEIDAGGAFRGLGDRLGAVRLDENRRQREAWERTALVDVREGRPEAALRAYAEHGRITAAPTAAELRGQIVADFLTARDGGEDVRMVARGRFDVQELNREARAALVARGDVAGPELALPYGRFAAGDDVVLRRNDRELGVQNGSRGQITAVDEQTGAMAVRLHDEDRQVVLPAAYLGGHRDDGTPHVMHGYATTAHLAQGATYDRALVLAGREVSQEWGYVALSRGREGSHLYAVAANPLEDARHHEVGAPRTRPQDARAVLAQALSRSEAKQMALDLTAPAPSVPQQREEARPLAGGAREAGLATRVRQQPLTPDGGPPRPTSPEQDGAALVARDRELRQKLRAQGGLNRSEFKELEQIRKSPAARAEKERQRDDRTRERSGEGRPPGREMEEQAGRQRQVEEARRHDEQRRQQMIEQSRQR